MIFLKITFLERPSDLPASHCPLSIERMLDLNNSDIYAPLFKLIAIIDNTIGDASKPLPVIFK